MEPLEEQITKNEQRKLLDEATKVDEQLKEKEAVFIKRNLRRKTRKRISSNDDSSVRSLISEEKKPATNRRKTMNYPKTRLTFNQRFEQLMKYKADFGHCNVPETRTSEHYSLGKWCAKIRQSSRALKHGRPPPIRYISTSQFIRLEKEGFVFEPQRCLTFDDRFQQLMNFKAEFGHCNVPRSKSNTSRHHSLGLWTAKLRGSYNRIKQGLEPTTCKISSAQIQRLDEAGFLWKAPN